MLKRIAHFQPFFSEHDAYEHWTTETRHRPWAGRQSRQISAQPSAAMSTPTHTVPASSFGAQLSDQGVQCTICNSILENRFQYQRHMNEFHRESMPFTCSHCQRGFFSKVGLHQHELQHTGQLFSCTWCTSSFTFKRNLNRHIEMIHGIKFCRHCSGTYKITEASSHVCVNMNS